MLTHFLVFSYKFEYENGGFQYWNQEFGFASIINSLH